MIAQPLPMESIELLRENSKEIAAIHVVPETGMHTWSVIASRVVPPVVVLIGGITEPEARGFAEDARVRLEAMRYGREPEPARPPEPEQRGRTIAAPSKRTDYLPTIETRPDDQTVEGLRYRLRAVLPSLATLTLREISELGLIPHGAWRLLGAKSRLINRVSWSPLKGPSRSSHVHRTFDRLQTLCRQEIPDIRTHDVRFGRAKGRLGCRVCDRAWQRMKELQRNTEVGVPK